MSDSMKLINRVWCAICCLVHDGFFSRLNTKYPKQALTRAANVGVSTISRIPKWIGYSGGPFFSSSNLLRVTLMVAKDVLISFS